MAIFDSIKRFLRSWLNELIEYPSFELPSLLPIFSEDDINTAIPDEYAVGQLYRFTVATPVCWFEIVDPSGEFHAFSCQEDLFDKTIGMIVRVSPTNRRFMDILVDDVLYRIYASELKYLTVERTLDG